MDAHNNLGKNKLTVGVLACFAGGNESFWYVIVTSGAPRL
jgi:hypothetical protein